MDSMGIEKVHSVFMVIIMTLSITIISALVLKIYTDKTITRRTEEFARNVRYEGYISKDMYEDYMESISFHPYKVKYVYKENYMSPTGEKVYTMVSEKEIVNHLYNSDEPYKFKKYGDFEVRVYEFKPSFYDAIMQAINIKTVKERLITTKGGMIFNERYK